MAEFTKQDVQRLATLAHLEVPEAELEAMRSDLSKIVEYVNRIEAVDVTGLKPMLHPFDKEDVWREDVVEPSLTQDQALANAPHRVGEFFAFPRIVPGKKTESNQDDLAEEE